MLEEPVSSGTAIQPRLVSLQWTIDDLAGEPKQRLFFVDPERNVDEVVVGNYDVEIHYKFPM